MPKRKRSYREALLTDLRNPAEAASYLNAALEDSYEMFLEALRDVAEASQMAKVAEAAGVARESLYRMLTGQGNPTLVNLAAILRALGLKLAIETETEAFEGSGREPQTAGPGNRILKTG
jgi:probable addiction module antidote protein